MRSSIDDNESFVEAAGSLRFNNPPTDPNTLQQELVGSSGMQSQEWSENGCFNNPSLPNDLNTIRRMGSSSSSIVMPPNLSDLELEKPKYVFDIFFPISLEESQQLFIEASLMSSSYLFSTKVWPSSNGNKI